MRTGTVVGDIVVNFKIPHTKTNEQITVREMGHPFCGKGISDDIGVPNVVIDCP